MFASTVSFGLAKKKLIFSIDHKKTETLTFVFNIVFFSIKTQHPLKRSREGRVILHLSKSFKKKNTTKFCWNCRKTGYRGWYNFFIIYQNIRRGQIYRNSTCLTPVSLRLHASLSFEFIFYGVISNQYKGQREILKDLHDLNQ